MNAIEMSACRLYVKTNIYNQLFITSEFAQMQASGSSEERSYVGTQRTILFLLCLKDAEKMKVDTAALLQ